VVSVCLLVAVFGQDLGIRLTKDEVQAETWVEQNAPAGSTIVNTVGGPVFLTRRYPLIGDETSLLGDEEFRGHLLGPADIPRVERYFAELRPAFGQFLVLSKRQDDYARLNGMAPRGSIPRLAHAIPRSAAFRLVYRRPTAWVFEYVAPRGPYGCVSNRTVVVHLGHGLRIANAWVAINGRRFAATKVGLNGLRGTPATIPPGRFTLVVRAQPTNGEKITSLHRFHTCS
jgi:hypothetical protein